MMTHVALYMNVQASTLKLTDACRSNDDNGEQGKRVSATHCRNGVQTFGIISAWYK